MRRSLAILMLVASCDIDDTPPAPPDAVVDDFGSACTPDGTAPITTCETPHHLVGWCVDDGSAYANTCRRNCDDDGCRGGDVEHAWIDDCYCAPM